MTDSDANFNDINTDVESIEDKIVSLQDKSNAELLREIIALDERRQAQIRNQRDIINRLQEQISIILVRSDRMADQLRRIDEFCSLLDNETAQHITEIIAED